MADQTNASVKSELDRLTADFFRAVTFEADGAPQYNELEYARRAAREFGAEYHEVMINHEDAISFLPEMIFHQDEPIGQRSTHPPANIAVTTLSRTA